MNEIKNGLCKIYIFGFPIGAMKFENNMPHGRYYYENKGKMLYENGSSQRLYKGVVFKAKKYGERLRFELGTIMNDKIYNVS